MPITMIAVFASRQQVVDAVDCLGSLQLIDVSRAAVVAKADSGETIVVDNDITPREGRKAGIGLGAVLSAVGFAQMGALALPGIGPLIALGAGAVFGGLLGGATGQFATILVSFGFQREQVDRLANHLEQGEVALMLRLEERDHLPQIRAELDRLDVLYILETEGKVPMATDFKRLPSRRGTKIATIKTANTYGTANGNGNKNRTGSENGNSSTAGEE